MRIAPRLSHIAPFYVMEVAKQAAEIARSPACDPAQGGRRMLYLNIGEPDLTALPDVQREAVACIEAGTTGYTPALGLPELRQALSRWYASQHGVTVGPERIVITAGASAALQLACLALVDAGDEVLIPDPSYPCNRHFVRAAGGVARDVVTHAADGFQATADAVVQAWTDRTVGVLLASPANPTGTTIAPDTLAAIADAVRARGAWLMVDEIYQGLCQDAERSRSALALGPDIVSINSFSKAFGMTGWRLGWLVLPECLVEPVERLAQNLYICASTVAQRAAIAAFTPASLAALETRRQHFNARREQVLGRLQAMGWDVPAVPDGGFYVWIDTRRWGRDSWDLCQEWMQTLQVTLTPGRDFGPTGGAHHVRLSFAAEGTVVDEALDRLAQWTTDRTQRGSA